MKDRRIVHIVLSYLGAAWIALTVVDQLVGRGVLPGFVYQLALIWVVGCFPAAMVVGWHHGEKGRQKAPISEIVVLLAIFAGVTVVSGATLMDNLARRAAIAAAEASTRDLRSIAVLYFDDRTPGGGYRHIADGLTEELIDQLGQVRGLDVVSANGVAPFRGVSVRRDSIADVLDAGTVVDGSVERVGDRLRIGLRILEGRSGVEFQRTSFERDAEDVEGVLEQVGRESAQMLRQWLGEEVRVRRAQRSTENTAAWVLYQRGLAAQRDAQASIRAHDAHEAMRYFAEADSILGQVEVLDPDWPDPVVARAEVAYRVSRLHHDRHDMLPWIDTGLVHAERALLVRDRYPPALAMRGTLRYLRYLLRPFSDPERLIALRSAARSDLERAVNRDPTQAQAWSTLQHLYQRDESITDAVLAGRRAYEEDAYLEAAHDILWRLTTGNYDLAQFDQSQRWCDEGARRFPESDRFALCSLLLMTAPGARPDPERAWATLARVDSLAPDHMAELTHLQGLLLVGGALGRAGMPDSAGAVLQRAHRLITPSLDPQQELLSYKAAMWAQMGEVEEAIELLKRVRAGNPEFDVSHHWWWQPVRSHPRYRELIVE